MEQARTALQKFAVALLRGVSSEDAALLAWPLACGAMVAARTRSLSFYCGVLQVEVPDRSWRAQLASFLPHYLNALRKAGAEVQQIEFVVPGERIRTRDTN